MFSNLKFYLFENFFLLDFLKDFIRRRFLYDVLDWICIFRVKSLILVVKRMYRLFFMIWTFFGVIGVGERKILKIYFGNC